MTCFWKGIINCLDVNDFNKFGINRKPTEYELVKLLKLNNKLCYMVKCHDEYLSDIFLHECKLAINELDINSIKNGYYCSTCDPFLILVCNLFKCNIEHDYCNHKIKYEIYNSIKTINVKSNKSHFEKS